MRIDIKVDYASKAGGIYSLYLSFPYDAETLEVIKSFPQRWWHPERKMWELPLSAMNRLNKKFAGCKFSIYDKYMALQKKEFRMPEGFEFKTKPFAHQMEGFKYGLTNDKWLLGDEQGLGKTKQVIDIAVAKKIEKGYRHCLIICGVNGLKWNWMNEIHIHSNEEARILGQKKTKNGLSIGSNKDKLNDLMQMEKDDTFPYFIITNIETLRDAAIQEQIKNLCEKKSVGIVAADECHKMKNPTSQQGKGLLNACCSEVQIAMTGTPLMNSPLDLYIILKWLGYESRSFYAFKSSICIMGGYRGHEVVGYKKTAMNDLQEQIDEIMLRRRKTDVLDLPEKIPVDEYVEMGKNQQRIYNEVVREIRSNIDQIALSPDPLAQIIRLRQATGYTGILSSEIHESAKMDRMEELVEDAIANERQVVIFSNWTSITDEIIRRIRQYNPGLITGQTKDNERQEAVDRFQSGDYKVMVGTIGAMGTGLTLTAGTVVIFMDEPWNKALKDQAEDRCHRVGTKENVTIYNLICKDSIDERIHELVMQKGLMADAIIDGKINTDKKALVEYLVG